MSEGTPRTDALANNDLDSCDLRAWHSFARTLERELQAAQMRVGVLEALVERYESLFWLAARDVVFFGTYNSEQKDWDDGWHPAINNNDTFYYASADAHAFKPERANELKGVFDKWGWEGLVALCSIERDEMPLKQLQTPKFHAARAALQGAEDAR